MATVFIQKRKSPKTGKKTYQIQYKNPTNNKTCYYKTFRKAKEAQRAAQDLRALIDNGEVYKIDRKKRKIRLLKFSEVAELAVVEWKNKLSKNELSETTYADYTLRVDVLNRVFGETLLINISSEKITDYQAAVYKKLSPASANRYLFIIKQIFLKGLEAGAINEDQSANIKYLNEKQHERNKFLLPQNIEKLIEVSGNTKAKFYMPALIYLGAEHGASKQEVLSLQWPDINFQYKEVGVIRFFRTKNGNERTEFLMPRAKQALLDWKAHQEWMRKRKKIKVKKDQYVFSHLNGAPIKRFDTAWRRICELAGIANFHYHDLRHTFCSNLIMAGADLKTVKEMIGHSDIAMTDRYSHLSTLHKRAVQVQLAEHYSKKG